LPGIRIDWGRKEHFKGAFATFLSPKRLFKVNVRERRPKASDPAALRHLNGDF